MRSFFDNISFQNTLKQSAEIKSLGFVPTMGALHQGHLSLIERALAENDLVVVSIFINPTQFNNLQDFETYPRTVSEDLEKLTCFDNKLLVFVPQVEVLYPDGLVSETFDFGPIQNQMEGKHRPGHFDGVGTVVKKLFTLVKPHKAYFGEKDFQQLQIVKKLVEIESLPVTIIGCPIFREPNGLAMSSRNKKLSPIQFEEASLLYKALQEAKEMFANKTVSEINEYVASLFHNHPHLELEYFEIADQQTLKPTKTIAPTKKYRAFIAAHASDVRLIDNIALN